MGGSVRRPLGDRFRRPQTAEVYGLARYHGSNMRNAGLRILPPSLAGALLIAAAVIATGPLSTGSLSTNAPALLRPSPAPHAIVSSIVPASTAQRDTTPCDHEARPVLAVVGPTGERANRLT